MRIAKVFNNSVVLAVDGDDREVVVIGTGIGFQAKPGHEIDDAAVERVFYPGRSANLERVAAVVEGVAAADFDVTEELIGLARQDLGPHVSDTVLVALADHIGFAIERVAQDVEPVEYPLRWEVTRLYPREVAFGRRAIEVIEQRRGVRLPAAEAVPLALHFVNAQFGSVADMTATVEMTQIISDTLGLVKERLGVEVDEESAAVARFVVHLRYLFVRQTRGEAVVEDDDPLATAVRDGAPAEYEVATSVAEMLRARFGWDVGEQERMYLTLHVSRLRSGSARRAPSGR